MKRGLIAIITILCLSPLSAQMIERDKQLHAMGGAFVGGVTYALGLDLTDGNKSQAKIIGISSSLLIGVLKETLDKRISNQGGGGNGFDWEDVGYTVAGGIVGTYTFEFLANRASRRQAKRLDKLKSVYNE